jgi:hypothetical protein
MNLINTILIAVTQSPLGCDPWALCPSPSLYIMLVIQRWWASKVVYIYLDYFKDYIIPNQSWGEVGSKKRSTYWVFKHQTPTWAPTEVKLGSSWGQVGVKLRLELRPSWRCLNHPIKSISWQESLILVATMLGVISSRVRIDVEGRSANHWVCHWAIGNGIWWKVPQTVRATLLT